MEFIDIDTFDTVKAGEMIERFEDGEEIYEYLQSEQYFKNFAAQLAIFIRDKGIDRKELNEKLGRVNLNGWLSGKRIPSREKLIEICFALHLDDDECDLLITKFAGEQELNIHDPYDMVYLFCLAFDMDYSEVEAYMEARALFDEGREAEIDIPLKEEFVKALRENRAEEEDNIQRKAKIIREVMKNPKVNLGDFSEADGIVKPIAEFMFSDEDMKKSTQKLQKIMSGRVPVKRSDFIKILIVCGYCGLDEYYEKGADCDIRAGIKEINALLEQAGFYPLYARNQYDCIYIAAAMQTILNEKISLPDYLKELSGLFEKLGAEEYVIFEPEKED